jgi:hypothetical protein
MIKPCETRLQKLTEKQLQRWDATVNPFSCLVCGKKHGTYNALYLHLYWKHPDKKLIKCRLCNKYIITSKGGIQTHLDEFHRGEMSTSLKSSALKCQFCEKLFTGQHRKYLRSHHLKNDHSDVAIRCALFNCCR